MKPIYLALAAVFLSSCVTQYKPPASAEPQAHLYFDRAFGSKLGLLKSQQQTYRYLGTAGECTKSTILSEGLKQREAGVKVPASKPIVIAAYANIYGGKLFDNTIRSCANFLEFTPIPGGTYEIRQIVAENVGCLAIIQDKETGEDLVNTRNYSREEWSAVEDACATD